MNRLKRIRENHKINQTELAKVLNTTQRQISLYETGKRKLDEDQIIKICRYYHVSADWLLGLDEDWQTKHAARISRGVFVCALTRVASRQAGKPAERRTGQPGGSADESREFSYTPAASLWRTEKRNATKYLFVYAGTKTKDFRELRPGNPFFFYFSGMNPTATK